MACPLYRGLWGLMGGQVGGGGWGGGLYMLRLLYIGLWGLMRGFCICHVHYIQGCGA